MLSECDCYAQGELDSDFFWSAVRQNTQKWKNTLIYEQYIYLDNIYDCIVVLGIDPLNRFAVSARIEVRSMNSCIHLDAQSMIKRANIKMSRDALLTLRQKQSLIQMQMSLMDCKKYESLYFNLLSHFSFEATEKTLLKALHSHTPSNFFSEICKFECTCLNMSFTLEIALHCSDWFISCVPLFIKALMQTRNDNCAILNKTQIQ